MKQKKVFSNFIIVTVLVSLNFCSMGCKKYLEAKPEKSLQVPNTLDDLQAILDYTDDMNNASPMALEIPADDYTLLDASWNSLTYNTMKNLYIWESDVFNDNLDPGDWASSYVPVYRANLVLENIGKIERTPVNALKWDQVRGAALFFRARSFYEIAQIWTKPYNKNTAANDLGIPLRLSTDFNETSIRSTVQDTYDRIISDLKSAVALLPSSSAHVTRPSKPAAYGFLARVSLVMQDYVKAGDYADSCLNIKNTLIDYNTVSSMATYPFPRFNEEVIFNSMIPAQTVTTNGRIAEELYQEYDDNDIRKEAFFRTFASNTGGGVGFKGSYYGSRSLFNGIATDEMYLIRAESSVRKSETEKALKDLNTLLETRYSTGEYIPYNIQSVQDVLSLVLLERRKELVFRGLRWADLKRLNNETKYAKVLRRELNGTFYELPPNDPRYAIPIPNSVIEISGILQN